MRMLWALAFLAGAVGAEEVIFFRGFRVDPGQGGAMVEDAAIEVSRGKILRFGPASEVAPSPNSRIVDLQKVLPTRGKDPYPFVVNPGKIERALELKGDELVPDLELMLVRALRQGKIACEMKLPPDRVEALRRAREGGKYPMARLVESAPLEGYWLGVEEPPMPADFMIWEIVGGSDESVVYEWAGVVIGGQLWSRGQFEWRAQRLEQVWPELRKVLDAQAAAWNKGDLEGYMEGYARSPDTLFLGGATMTRGYDEVLERYKKKYTPQNMGKLAFSDLELTLLGSEGALVPGRWQLTREKDSPKGLFTLLFRKLPEGWRIVVDHSSTEQ